MTSATLLSKNRVTIGIEIVRELKLTPGTRFRQTLRAGKIILEPLPDVMTAFGALKSKQKFVSINAETEAMEKAVGKEIGERFDRLVKAGVDLAFYRPSEYAKTIVSNREEGSAK